MKNLSNKNIICVGTYFNNKTKLNMTEKTLEFLFKNKNKLNSDIMLVSKSIVPEKLFKYIDYLVYDKKNELIESFGVSSAITEYDTKFGYKIYSNFENTINTTIPALNIFISGLINGLYLGYKNMHFIEYDVTPSDNIINQLINNNKLLDDKSVEFVIYSDKPDSMVGGFFSVSLNHDKSDFFKKYDPNNLLNELNKRLNSENLSATCEKIILHNINKTPNKVLIKSYDEIKDFYGKITHKTKIISTMFYDNRRETYGVFIGNISNEDIQIKRFECLLNERKILDVRNINLNLNDWLEYYDIILNESLIHGNELIFKIDDKIFANYKFNNKDDFMNFFKKNKKLYE